MSSFTTPLVVSPMPDGRRWKLVNSFTYRVGSKNRQDKIVVLSGTVTDFASVPRFLWWLIPPWGKYGKAAVLHDYLYQGGVVASVNEDGVKYTRRVKRDTADGIFYEAMEVLGVPWWKKQLMYWAVRLFGGIAWKK